MANTKNIFGGPICFHLGNSSSSPNNWMTKFTARTHTHTDIRRRMPRAKLIKLIRKIFWVFFGLFIFAAQTSTSYEKRIEVSETKNVLGPNLSHRVFSFVPIPENLTFIFWACWTKCKVTADFRDVNRRNYMCECDTTELALCFSGTRAHTIFGRGSVISSSHNMMRSYIYNIVISVNYIGNLFPINLSKKSSLIETKSTFAISQN